MKKLAMVPLSAIILFLNVSVILAVDYDYKITMGATLTSFNTSMQVNGDSSDGNRAIVFEDDLGFDDSTNLYIFSLETKFTDNHRFYINVTPLSRNANKTLTGSIDFEDDTILTDTDIESKFSNTIIDLKYGYRFKTSENSEFEAIAGIYWMRTRYKLNASGSIENELGEINFETDYEKTRSVGLPLPLFGIGYRYYVNNDWTILGSARYFSASYNDLDGSISSFFISTEYTPNKSWGVGVSLNYLDMDFNITKDHFKGTFDWQHSGLNAYLFYNF